MLEIKFLKDLPLKHANQNKTYITILGGDIYYDKDGNRYAFITFKNLRKTPIYALHLSYREYSADGKLIKNGEFYIPNMYEPKGEFVNETPIQIDEQTEAIEIFILKAVYDHDKFENDKLRSFKTIDYIEEPKQAPKKRLDSKSEFVFEEKVEEETIQEVTPNESAVTEEIKEVEKADETSTPINEEKKEEVATKPTGFGKYKTALGIPYFIVFALAIAAMVFLIIYSTSAAKKAVEFFNQNYMDGNIW